MQHFGDITQLKGANIPPVNVIIGGSPCQDLSIAGRRAGLAGERSGLFMEQIRIIKEMRKADAISGRKGRDIRPRYMVWENVVGAFSSNGGKTSKPSSKKRSALQNRTRPTFHYLNAESGLWQIPTTEMGGLLPTAFSTRSFGESPSVAVESRLSQILEGKPLPKYSLSAKACAGIRRRAARRGKELPPMLDRALLEMIERQGGTRDN